MNYENLIKSEVERISTKYNKDFLDCEDLMKITGLGRDNVRNLLRSKNFPTTKVGKRQVVSVLNFVTWQIMNGEDHLLILKERDIMAILKPEDGGIHIVR